MAPHCPDSLGQIPGGCHTGGWKCDAWFSSLWFVTIPTFFGFINLVEPKQQLKEKSLFSVDRSLFAKKRAIPSAPVTIISNRCPRCPFDNTVIGF